MRTRVDFPGCALLIDPAARTVTTAYADGRESRAARPDTPENRAEAFAEGYGAGGDAVWRCLVEHELAHHFVPCAAGLWARYGRFAGSAVLRFEAAGDGPGRMYWRRLYEEALVIAFQVYCNTGRIEPPLAGIATRERLENWRARARELILAAAARPLPETPA